MNTLVLRKQKISYRIRKKVHGTAERPRLAVFRSNTNIYAQLINDDASITLVSSSSKDKVFSTEKVTKTMQSLLVGKSIAQKALSLGISKCVFDRGGNLYHGRVKALADGAREGGLLF